MSSEELSDNDILYESLVKQKEKKMNRLDEVTDKEVEVDELISIVNNVTGGIPIKLKVFEDAMEDLIDSHETFIGDNPEVLVGSDKTKYEYISDMLKNLEELLDGAKIEKETLQELKDRYVIEGEKLSDEIQALGRRIDVIANEIARKNINRKAPTKKVPAQSGLRKVLMILQELISLNTISTFLLIFGMLYMLLNENSLMFLVDSTSENIMSGFFPVFILLLGFIIYSIAPKRKKRRRYRRR